MLWKKKLEDETSEILWHGLCTFTWKKKASTKKEAVFYKENPDAAIGDKLRIDPDSSMVGLNASGGIIKESKKKDK